MPDPKTEILSPSDLTVLGNMEVKNEDLVAVAVARRERALEQRLLEAERRYQSLQRSLESTLKQIDEQVIALVESEYTDRVNALKAAFSGFGQGVKVKLNSGLNVDAKCIDVSIHVSPERGRCGDTSFCMDRLTLEVTESILDIHAKSRTLRGELEKAVTDRVELKKALGNMATTERRARAALAEASLGSSERGRALLAAMNDIPDLLAVPALDIIEVKE
jgi:hypothetical protein